MACRLRDSAAFDGPLRRLRDAGTGEVGYVLDVQADFLQDLNTRIVVPLLPPDVAPKPARSLNPVFDIGGHIHVMLTQFISSVPAEELGEPLLALDARSDDIMRALDMLLVGF